jgi:hypothetical protein
MSILAYRNDRWKKKSRDGDEMWLWYRAKVMSTDSEFHIDVPATSSCNHKLAAKVGLQTWIKQPTMLLKVTVHDQRVHAILG